MIDPPPHRAQRAARWLRKSARRPTTGEQFVFTENRVGRLHDLTSLFRAHNVHIMALTVLDTTDCAIDRLIVDDPEKARELMVSNDFPTGKHGARHRDKPMSRS